MPSRHANDWMWAEACEMLERAERLHRHFFRVATVPAARPTWEPPVDVIETASDIAIVVALPGVEASQIDIALDGDVLRISGARPLPMAHRSATIHRLEIPHGHFDRRIGLPSDRLRLARRELIDGCLLLVFEKTG